MKLQADQRQAGGGVLVPHAGRAARRGDLGRPHRADAGAAGGGRAVRPRRPLARPQHRSQGPHEVPLLEPPTG